MKHTRFVAIGALATACTLAFTACGTDNNSTTSSSSATTSSSASDTMTSSASTGTSSSMSASGAAGGIQCAKGSLQLAGSTAQTNAFSVWRKDYQQRCSGATVNYGGGGSGKGVQNFEDGTIDFAGSDFPLSGDDVAKANAHCKAGPALNLPMVPGPIAVGYNLPGVKDLNLSAPVLAKIFSGKITKWNDSEIKKDNPSASLPSATIQTFHRADGSGTSFNFSNYLAHDAKSDWSYGANKTWPAPTGQGEKGTAGIAQSVKSTPGGVGYMELSYATQNNISYARVGNSQGKFISLTNDNVVKFLSLAKVVGTGNNLPLQFDYATSDTSAYPAMLVTYEIVCSAGNPSGKVALIKGFLGYIASDAAQKELPSSGYVRLASNLQQKVQAAIATIK